MNLPLELLKLQKNAEMYFFKNKQRFLAAMRNAQKQIEKKGEFLEVFPFLFSIFV